MKMLCDYSGGQIHYGRGIGRYIENFLDALMEIEPGMAIDLLVSNDLPRTPLMEDGKHRLIHSKPSIKLSGRYDFLLVPNFFNSIAPLWAAPDILARCAAVVGIVYDLIPLIFHDRYLNDPAAQKVYKTDLSCLEFANHLFAISESTRGDILTHTGLADVTTIYGGIDKKFTLFHDGGPKGNDVIYVSGANPRKNYVRSTQAFCTALARGSIPSDAVLKIICRNDKDFDNEIYSAIDSVDPALRKHVKIMGYLPDSEMMEHISRARFSIFFSEYEGLGLPILESYALGTACIGSDTSSMRELLPITCQASPHSVEAMADKITEAFHNRQLLDESLTFGRDILKKITWENAAATALAKMKGLMRERAGSDRTAVFTTWPPAFSGIATYSANTFTSQPDKFDIFTGVASEKEYEKILEGNSANKIFPSVAYQLIKLRRQYKNRLYVFGNSPHNTPTLAEAIRNAADNAHAWGYLHEIYLRGLWDSWCQLKEIATESLYDEFYDKQRASRYGLFPLAKLTGLRKFFVNNGAALQMARSELAELPDVEIIQLFHPVEDMGNPGRHAFPPQAIVIGSFGIPGKHKGTDTIIEAMRLLNAKSDIFKLVLAGYEVEAYLAGSKYTDSFIIPCDSPVAGHLFALMNSVDVAVQLRPVFNGESSGCVAQLLALGKRCLVSPRLVPPYASDNLWTVPDDASPEALAARILEVVGKPAAPMPEETLERYSYAALAEKLMAYL